MDSVSEKTVYLEDLEVKETKNVDDSHEDENDKEKSPTTVTETLVEVTEAVSKPVNMKRQRTLMEMVPAGSAKAKDTPNKKAKLTKTALQASILNDQDPVKAINTGIQPLNSIPFSLQAFKDSLSEEEKNLLALECECMGKSW